MSIKIKVIASMVIVLFLGTIALVFIANKNYDNSVAILGNETLHGALQAFTQLEQSDVKMLSAVSVALRTNDAIGKAYADRKRDEVYALATPIYKELKEQYGITHWNLIDAPPNNVIFARLSKPELFNDTVKRNTYLDAVKTGTLTFGKEVGKTGFVLRTVAPFMYKGKLIGYQEIGEDIDKFFKLIKKQMNSDVALIVDKKYLSHKEWQSTQASKHLADNWDAFKSNLVVSNTSETTSMLPMDISVTDVPEGGSILGVIEQNGKVFQRSLFPVQDASHRTVGCVMIVQDISAISAEMKGTRSMLILFTIVLSIILCALIIALLYLLVFNRLNRMIEMITRVVGGDVGYVTKETDEIGRFEAQIVEVLRSLLG
ncbi:MAG TPA: cache domain-containing protein [Bacteroidota bacterium]|nr:cache domain-containing protein [Bacteroidota bacterium]